MKELQYVLNRWNLTPKKPFWPVQIPNERRDVLASIFKDLGYKVGAEIGVERGRFSQQIMQAVPGLKMYGVDHYGDYGGRYGKNQEANFAEAQERLKGYDYTFIKKTSADALADIPDGSLDFVYIDGDHEFSHVAFDLVNWYKKVRIGGILSGHDYSIPRHRYGGNGELKQNVTHHVKEAVDGFMLGYQIEPWFVIGRTERRPGEIRELLRSWFCVRLK